MRQLVAMLRERTGCSADEALRAIQRVGPSYELAVDWLRRTMRQA